ncbi:hypothetical protein ACQ4PT_067518 [Festuca glaucescens]
MATRCRCNLSCYLPAALLLLVTAFLNAPLTAAQPLPWQLCGNNTGNYTEGSAYQANIRVLASVFPTNASASPALFTKGSAGTAPDAVYALALCRGHTNASSCASCTTTSHCTAYSCCTTTSHCNVRLFLEEEKTGRKKAVSTMNGTLTFTGSGRIFVRQADSEKRRDLDWGKRLKIVNGVARGLQYLHEDSQLRIVHRDLKASNVLLDSDCNPKISDFGLAKLFGWDQSRAVTSHIAGTYGYMAPEYAMRGQYSVKSDAFSFGILLLEIVTGRKNSSFADSEQSIDLLSLVWEHWTTGTVEELADPSQGGRSPGGQMLKLVNIGLLCVQDNPADRPTMSTVNVMLSSSTVSLQAPSRPTFCVGEMEGYSDMYSEAPYLKGSQSQYDGDSKPTAMSPNEVSLTELEPR